jgi:hypothetical protein
MAEERRLLGREDVRSLDRDDRMSLDWPPRRRRMSKLNCATLRSGHSSATVKVRIIYGHSRSATGRNKRLCSIYQLIQLASILCSVGQSFIAPTLVKFRNLRACSSTRIPLRRVLILLARSRDLPALQVLLPVLIDICLRSTVQRRPHRLVLE